MANNQNSIELFRVVGNGGEMYENLTIPTDPPMPITRASLQRIHRHFWSLFPSVHHLNSEVKPDGTLVSPTAQEQFLKWLDVARKNSRNTESLLLDGFRLELPIETGHYMQPYAIPSKRPAGNFPPMVTKYLRDSFIAELSEEQRTQLCFDHGPDGHFTTEATVKLFNDWIDNKIATVGAMQMGKHMLSLHERAAAKKPFKNGMPPMHPGLILKEMFLDEMNVTPCQLAKHLRCSLSIILDIIAGARDVDATVAIWFSRAFGTTPEMWMNMQQSYDLKKIFSHNADFGSHIKPIVAITKQEG